MSITKKSTSRLVSKAAKEDTDQLIVEIADESEGTQDRVQLEEVSAPRGQQVIRHARVLSHVSVQCRHSRYRGPNVRVLLYLCHRKGGMESQANKSSTFHNHQ